MNDTVWLFRTDDEWLLTIAEGTHGGLDPRRPLVPVLQVPVAAEWQEGRDFTFEPMPDHEPWYGEAPTAWREAILEGDLVVLRGVDGWGGVWEIDTSHINATRFFLRTGAHVAHLRAAGDAAGEAAGEAAGDAAGSGAEPEGGAAGPEADGPRMAERGVPAEGA